MFQLTKSSLQKLITQKERKKYTRHTPNKYKKYQHLLKYLWNACIFLTFLTVLPLEAQEINKKIDPVDTKFSGALSVIPELVAVGDAGNLPDPLTGLGAVQESFQIGKYPVTVLQWATFLNAVHVVEGNKDDPRNLYHEEMFDPNNQSSCLSKISGVVRTKISSTDFTSHVTTLFFAKEYGMELGHYYASLPMTGLSIDDCKRYLNWLHNGAPDYLKLCQNDPPYVQFTLNAKLLAITETGAYDFTEGHHGELMKGARYFLPSLDQWYKAAYYKAQGKNTGYWSYPTQSAKLPYQTPSPTVINNPSCSKTGANFAIIKPHKKYYMDDYHQIENLFTNEIVFGENELEKELLPNTTPVGLFKDSPSSYGTYDQGGNVREWTSEFFAPGGSYNETSDQLKSENANKKSFDPSTKSDVIGLRICTLANTDNLSENRDTGCFKPNPDLSITIRDQVENVAIAQITAYGLEAMLFTAIKNYELGRLISLSEIIAPFTLQRNFINAVIGTGLAVWEGNTVHNSPFTKGDCWEIANVALEIALMGISVECGAAAFEIAVNYYIGANLFTSFTWARLALNVAYIGINTYSTTESDLKYFREQQKN
ncbi:MAG: SUMF1/EgtB/PvdO family nonheme iron enzyme [Verrucomicrobiae bacterium]|jgi:formylglycine-generating enzyme required for sulfatase activity|nr:SUMF1/EgtB/PvdO family nonheme iron enzyme [Verrucomicrobiae bacterium]